MFFNVMLHDSIMFKYSCRDQAFRLVVRDHPVLSSQSMVINSKPGSARPVGSCQKFPWHGTRKNIMCKNSPLFQHCHFFHDKLLTMNPCRFTNIGTNMLSRRLRSIAVDCDVDFIRYRFYMCRKCT